MNNLFSVFDPRIRLIGFSQSLNWLRSLTCMGLMVPAYWKVQSKVVKTWTTSLTSLEAEISTNLGMLPSPGLSHLVVRTFLMVALNNYLGLTPYTFTSRSHLTFTIRLALLLWLRMIRIAVVKDLSHSLAHLVPLGTPNVLIPLIVIIELIRNVIRPLTLSVRLAANIVAGHLLLRLISGALVGSRTRVLALGITTLILLMLLENGVALIQAYVFRILPSLYLSEVNYVKLNYLNNAILL